MIISELVSLLGFKVNPAGANQFDSILNRLAQKSGTTADVMSAAFAGAASEITKALAGISLVAFSIATAKAGDEMNSSLAKIESSIGRSATSGQEAADIYEKLYQVGTRTGVSADESAQSFTRFNLAMQDLHRPATDTITLIEGIQAAGIVAGTSTSELKNSVQQLGQALGSGKLQGDELKTLRESMPRFLRDVMREMHMTNEQFFKAAEKGLLTPAQVVPAMLAASETARRELANFPVSMARGFDIMKNSAHRFLAELDKQLGLSKLMASIFVGIAKTLDSWRSGLSVVHDLISAFGGLENVARVLGIALLVALGPVIIASIGTLISLFGTLAVAVGTVLIPLISIAAWALIIEDFIAWMQGRESLFGERFGEFPDIAAMARERIEAFRTMIEGVWQNIREGWNNQVEGMRPQVEWLLGAIRSIRDGFIALGAYLSATFGPMFQRFFDNILGYVEARFEAYYQFFARWFARIRALLPDWAGGGEAAPGGAGGLTDPGQQEQRRGRFGSRGAVGGFPDIFDPDAMRGLGMRLPDGAGAVARGVGGPLAGGATVINPQQDNTITNQVIINAPGADPASVAGAAQAGVTRAMDGSVSRLGGSLALGLGLATPRVERAAH